ncbi:MAG: nitronate monooxygenase [Planctomycetota bacterium]|jgi:nitronate monooxygenase
MQDIRIIQGGMGAGVSSWRLARTVASAGHLGVVSGTALDAIIARRLQDGDPGGPLRRALDAFPLPEMSERILERYFIEGGRAPDAPYRSSPMPAIRPSRAATELSVVANFAEVFLAREGHDGRVGINFLEKIQAPTLPAVYGAMLAGVDVVIMGAGIPRALPGILDAFAEGREARLPVTPVEGRPGPSLETVFDPAAFAGGAALSVERPLFLPIVSSSTLAGVLKRKATGRVDGFIVEGATAGGHNAPPRGPMQLDENGEPIYGVRDLPDLSAFRKMGLPFWLAGGQASPGRLREALNAGATGIQVGTAFAFCDESGIPADLKRRVVERVLEGDAVVRTDPVASPTGFPFKVLQLEGTASDAGAMADRLRTCDLGYLRQAMVDEAGKVTWRCPAEPEDDFLRKGGSPEDMAGRLCVCNGLTATIGLSQVRKDGSREAPLVTSGDDIDGIRRFLSDGATSYGARDVLDVLTA